MKNNCFRDKLDEIHRLSVLLRLMSIGKQSLLAKIESMYVHILRSLKPIEHYERYNKELMNFIISSLPNVFLIPDIEVKDKYKPLKSNLELLFELLIDGVIEPMNPVIYKIWVQLASLIEDQDELSGSFREMSEIITNMLSQVELNWHHDLQGKWTEIKEEFKSSAEYPEYYEKLVRIKRIMDARGSNHIDIEEIMVIMNNKTEVATIRNKLLV